MFDLSVEKLFILAIVALFVLGPQRLPIAAAWLARTLRQIKNFANDANQKLRNQLGPELDELRPHTHRSPQRPGRPANLARSPHRAAPPPIRPSGQFPPLPLCTSRRGTTDEPAAGQPATTPTHHRGTPTHRPRRHLNTRGDLSHRPPSNTRTSEPAMYPPTTQIRI
jgi:sec-independent protein translocase protein TatB